MLQETDCPKRYAKLNSKSADVARVFMMKLVEVCQIGFRGPRRSAAKENTPDMLERERRDDHWRPERMDRVWCIFQFPKIGNVGLKTKPPRALLPKLSEDFRDFGVIGLKGPRGFVEADSP